MSLIVDQVETTENGLRQLSLCQEFELSIAKTFFKKTDHRRLTWYHPMRKGAVLDFI